MIVGEAIEHAGDRTVLFLEERVSAQTAIIN